MKKQITVTSTLTKDLYLAMLREGAAKLNSRRGEINDLNVFPIPDGDTGDNMYMTISAGCADASGNSLGDLSASASKGMLLGARGNSGVILSRIFAGISKGLEGSSDADVAHFAEAMHCGVREAYGAVSVPVEGTILTVLRESVDAAEGEDFESYFTSLTAAMKTSLEHTPDLLEVLREAKVVDSGGAGMLCIAEGMLDALKGLRSDSPAVDAPSSAKVDLDDFGPDTPMKFGYCTEFLLRLRADKVPDPENFDISPIRDWLCANGESVVCFRESSIVKVHVHTFTPGEILNKMQQWGEFLTIKVENMTLQHEETLPGAETNDEFTRRQAVAIVAVASGDGLEAAYKEAGADFVVRGGQTMNPSAKDFLDAFASLRAETIVVLPNNSNIIMTARQAASIASGKEGCPNIVVIPTKDPGAGYVVAASLDRSESDPTAIEAFAGEILPTIATGLVSKATRDACMDGVSVREGDYVGISGGRIVTASADRGEVVLDLAGRLDTGSRDVALVFSGASVSSAEAQDLTGELQTRYTRTEFQLTEAGQPVYDYMIVLC